jgi:SAM-dependent methyltransferase
MRVAGDTDRERFYTFGRKSRRDIEAVLAVAGHTLADFERILDWGCGCGRILLWMDDVGAASSLYGVDIDERAVRWVQQNLRYVTASVCGGLPPLEFPDGFFDLVYNHSVLTHLDERYQDAWLRELRRVTRPGGLVLLSVHGDHAFSLFERDSANGGGDISELRARFDQEGFVFVDKDNNVGGPFPDFYHSSFHASWYVFEHWSRLFTIKAYVPRGSLDFQDFILLERPAHDLAEPVGRPERRFRESQAARADVAPRGAPEPSAEPTGVSAAIARAAVRLAQAPDVRAPSRYGAVAHTARKVVLRALRHYDNSQRKVLGDVLEALRGLEASVEHLAKRQKVGEGLTVAEAHIRIWDSLNNLGKRLNRLESDVWRAVEEGREGGSAPNGANGGRPGSPEGEPGEA